MSESSNKSPMTPEELESRERIIAHGMVGIHLKPEQLRALFEVADEQGTTPNVLARRWVIERLQAKKSEP